MPVQSRTSRPPSPPGSSNTDPHLVLKATPPKASRTQLPRERLGLETPALIDRSVILVLASAGFGKTALLSQWRREAIASGACVAWFSVDTADDTDRFVQGLRLATRIAQGQAVRNHDFGAGAMDAAPFERLALWLIEVAEFAGDILLVLDDAHALPPSSHGSLAYVLHHLPANLRVVVASRSTLPIQEGELLARGLIARIDAEALRFTLAETSSLLHNRFGNRIDADTCARLRQVTEGWPLGLQLAVSSMAHQDNLRDAVAACHDHAGDMHRFFVEILVKGLDPQDSAFLVAISFLDALHPDLCRAVTGREDGADILARLCDQTPILTEAVDSDWLRIHALAKEFLCERFDALPEETRRGYCAAACQWLAEHRFHEEAARHALGSGQEALAFDLVERSLYDIFITGQVARTVQWVERLSPAQLETRPRFRIALGWTLAQSARCQQAPAVVAPILDDLGADIVDRFESIQIVAAAAIYADKPDEARAVFMPWRERNSGFNPVQRQVTANIDAMLELHQGAPEQARFILSQAGGTDIEAGHYAIGWAHLITATSFFWQGQVIAAGESLTASLAEVEPVSGRRSPIACMLAAVLAAVYWERDQLDDIDALLADRRDIIDQFAMPLAAAMSYVVASRMAVLRGDSRLGHDLLERLFALGKSRDLPRLCIAALAEQMRLWGQRGHALSCETVAERLQPFRLDTASAGNGLRRRFIELQLGIADAYYNISREDWGRARSCLAQARSVAEQLRRNRDLLQIHFMDALAARQLGENVDARVQEGLYLQDMLGLRRLLADTHPLLVQWYGQSSPARSATGASPPRSARQQTPAAPRPGLRDEATAVAPSALLTAKEREVMLLLAKNLSNKEIATALDVSVDAVKWHLKNLFGKLGAGNRRHLVNRARMLGLIE